MKILDNRNSKWWLAEKDDVHTDLTSLIRYLESTQTARKSKYTLNQRLYADTDTTMNDVMSQLAGPYGMSNRLTLNICKSVVDTVSSKISKNKINPMVVTEGADWITQQKSKKLDRAIRGILRKANIQSLMREVFLDAAIFGMGALKVYPEDDEVIYERVLPEEIYVDELDSIYGKPKCLYQTRQVDRDDLITLFPTHEAELRLIKPLDNKAGAISASTFLNARADLIEVYEAWRLPIVKDQPGRHVLCTSSCTLIDEDWNEKEFPFVFYHWTKLPKGFYGQSIIDEVAATQMELNKIIYFIQQHMLHAQPKIFIDNGTKIPAGHWNNLAGSVVKYSGKMPTYFAPTPLPQQYIDYMLLLKNEAYSKVGISQLSARSEKPSGLNSGKALQTYNDIESERFILAGQQFEECYIKLFEKTLDCCKQIYKHNKSFGILSYDKKRGVEVINWEDIDLDKEKTIIQVFPVSALPKTPEGKMQFISELAQSGVIGPEDSVDLLDFPDLDSYKNEKFADIYEVRESLDRIIEKGEYIPPDSFSNLGLAKELGLKTYLQLKVKDAPIYILDLIQQYINEVIALEEQAAPPPVESTMQPSAAPSIESNPMAQMMVGG